MGYVALKRFKISGDSYAAPGHPLPEAGSWKSVRSCLKQSFVAIIPDGDEPAFLAAVESGMNPRGALNRYQMFRRNSFRGHGGRLAGVQELAKEAKEPAKLQATAPPEPEPVKLKPEEEALSEVQPVRKKRGRPSKVK